MYGALGNKMEKEMEFVGVETILVQSKFTICGMELPAFLHPTPPSFLTYIIMEHCFVLNLGGRVAKALF